MSSKADKITYGDDISYGLVDKDMPVEPGEMTLVLSELPALRERVKKLRFELHQAERELLAALVVSEAMTAVDELLTFLAHTDTEHFELYLHLTQS